MKRNIALAGLGMMFTLCLVLLPAAQAQDGGCSVAKAAGNWGFTIAGTLFVPGPVPGAGVGLLSIDAGGNITGTEWRNVAGGFAKESAKGSWTVNRDCSVSVTVGVFDESGALVRNSVFDGVLVDNSSKLRAVQESLSTPTGANVPVVITVEANRISSEDSN